MTVACKTFNFSFRKEWGCVCLKMIGTVETLKQPNIMGVSYLAGTSSCGNVGWKRPQIGHLSPTSALHWNNFYHVTATTWNWTILTFLYQRQQVAAEVRCQTTRHLCSLRARFSRKSGSRQKTSWQLMWTFMIKMLKNSWNVKAILTFIISRFYELMRNK